MKQRLENDGFAPLAEPLPDALLDGLRALFDDARPGERLTDSLPDVVAAALAWHPLTAALGEIEAGLRPVRVMLFAKQERANWFVPWHQDAAVAIEGDARTFGFVNRTVKRGVVHWEAPAELLARMLAVRIHVDAATPGNGPLEVVPGSHRNGFLDASSIDEARAVACLAKRGDVHLLRPLLLHRSRKAPRPSGRRTVQVEFAPRDSLPAGLRWRLAA